MKPLENRRAIRTTGTTGTEIRDKRVATLLLGLVLAACGGESNRDAGTSAANGGSANGSGGFSGSSCGETCNDPDDDGGGTDSTSATTTQTGTGGNSTVSGTSVTNTSSGSSGGSGGSSAGGGGSSAGSGGAAGSAGENCEPQDVAGVGACDAAFGVLFLGDQCGWVGGCSCEGEDCDNAYADQVSCETAHRECLHNACHVQDATYVGGCDPASVFVFNGFECVAMDGCSCVGGDCNVVFDSFDDCKASYSVCEDRALSCDEIEAAYDDYVSRSACQDDSDCTIVYGQCAIGLGGCHHAVNRRWGNSGVQALAEAWATRDCGGAVCDCPAPPETVVCDDGVCAFQE